MINISNLIFWEGDLFLLSKQCKANNRKNKKGIYILFPSHIQKRKHFCLNKNMNIKRVCLWSYLFKYDEMIEKKLVVLSFHEKKNHKRNPTHQTSINDCISLCVKSFFYLFVCLFVFAKEIFEVNVFSVKCVSFAFRKDHFGISWKNLFIQRRKKDFNEKVWFSFENFLLSQWDLFCSLMDKTLLIIRKWNNAL